MRVGSLFAGIGGFDLAARWMGWSTSWYSEIDPYACKVMRKNFPDAPNLGDITTLTCPPPVDVLVGGFPCQDISTSGKGAGIGGTRSGLWSHFARIIEETTPRWVVAENVSNLRSKGLDRVLQDFDALGYDATWDCIPASYVGARHKRDRIWIVAHAPDSNSIGAQVPTEGEHAAVQIPWRIGSPRSIGERRYDWTAESRVGRVAHGVPHRLDRLRCLGNAVVPQVAHLIFNSIKAHQVVGLSSF